MGWLDDNDNTSPQQFRCPRRAQASGVMVIHAAENTPDFVAFDGGAEAVANFIKNRTDFGSYHDLVDSDSYIHLVDYECEAFHVGRDHVNWFAWGGSVATRSDVWPFAPKRWRDGAIHNLAARAANYAKWIRARKGIIVPARRISRKMALKQVSGFISHAELDPERRTDPGPDFPWTQFLTAYEQIMNGEDDLTTPQQTRDIIEDVVGQFMGFPRNISPTKQSWMSTRLNHAHDYAKTAATRTFTVSTDIELSDEDRKALAIEIGDVLVDAEIGDLVVDAIHQRTGRS